MHYKLDTDKEVKFYEQEFYVLSNFSSFMVKWKGRVFYTAETAYHWAKFENMPFIQEYILNAHSSHEAFKIAEQWKEFLPSDWKIRREGVMKEILRCKVQQHPYVAQKLTETGNRILIEDSWRDDFWGWGPNKDGQNVLGKLWMEIRQELHDQD